MDVHVEGWGRVKSRRGGTVRFCASIHIHSSVVTYIVSCHQWNIQKFGDLYIECRLKILQKILVVCAFRRLEEEQRRAEELEQQRREEEELRLAEEARRLEHERYLRAVEEQERKRQEDEQRLEMERREVSSGCCFTIIRLHCMHSIDVALHVAWYVYVGYMGELCENGWTNQYAVSGADSCGLKEPCVRWGGRIHSQTRTDGDAAFCQITLDTCYAFAAASVFLGCLSAASNWLFVCRFVQTDLVTTICHERLEQPLWSIQGMTTDPYWWPD